MSQAVTVTRIAGAPVAAVDALLYRTRWRRDELDSGDPHFSEDDRGLEDVLIESWAVMREVLSEEGLLRTLAMAHIDLADSLTVSKERDKPSRIRRTLPVLWRYVSRTTLGLRPYGAFCFVGVPGVEVGCDLPSANVVSAYLPTVWAATRSWLGDGLTTSINGKYSVASTYLVSALIAARVDDYSAGITGALRDGTVAEKGTVTLHVPWRRDAQSVWAAVRDTASAPEIRPAPPPWLVPTATAMARAEDAIRADGRANCVRSAVRRANAAVAAIPEHARVPGRQQFFEIRATSVPPNQPDDKHALERITQTLAARVSVGRDYCSLTDYFLRVEGPGRRRALGEFLVEAVAVNDRGALTSAAGSVAYVGKSSTLPAIMFSHRATASGAHEVSAVQTGGIGAVGRYATIPALAPKLTDDLRAALETALPAGVRVYYYCPYEEIIGFQTPIGDMLGLPRVRYPGDPGWTGDEGAADIDAFSIGIDSDTGALTIWDLEGVPSVIVYTGTLPQWRLHGIARWLGCVQNPWQVSTPFEEVHTVRGHRDTRAVDLDGIRYGADSYAFPAARLPWWHSRWEGLGTGAVAEVGQWLSDLGLERDWQAYPLGADGTMLAGDPAWVSARMPVSLTALLDLRRSCAGIRLVACDRWSATQLHSARQSLAFVPAPESGDHADR